MAKLRDKPNPIFPPNEIKGDAWPFDDIFGYTKVETPNGCGWDRAMPMPLKGKILPYND